MYKSIKIYCTPGPGIRWAFTGPLVLWFGLWHLSIRYITTSGKPSKSCTNQLMLKYTTMHQHSNTTLHGQITQKLKEQDFSFLPMTHNFISWAPVSLWHIVRFKRTFHKLTFFRKLTGAIDHGQTTKTLKEQEFSVLPVTHIVISWAHLWSFIKLSCTVQELWQFSQTDRGHTFATIGQHCESRPRLTPRRAMPQTK